MAVYVNTDGRKYIISSSAFITQKYVKKIRNVMSLLCYKIWLSSKYDLLHFLSVFLFSMVLTCIRIRIMSLVYSISSTLFSNPLNL